MADSGITLGASLLNRNWKLKPHDETLNIIQNILINRGITDQDDVNAYLNPSYKKGFHNPFLMKDMDKAVERVKEAVAKNERIIVFGDYDVDGISGTAVLVNALKQIGANVSYRLPHRVKDGYGLSTKFIDEFVEKGVGLIVTVDCGISCGGEISYAKEKGIDVIITDHHTIPENPPTDAYATLHPKQEDCPYPFKGLTGSGVAYKLASALITDNFTGQEKDEKLYQLLDLASLGTVADIGPLLGENRIIVKYGLEALGKTKWKGLKLLLDQAGIDEGQKLDVSTIGFKIGPRINAAGRIDHPYRALKMLLHEGDDESGKEIAGQLEELNTQRQQMVFEALEEAFEMVAETAEEKKILIVWSPEWHMGILGLIAGKLTERYGIPTIAMQEFEGHLVASFRSNEKFNAVEALNNTSHLLDHYGGHFQAAGFNVKKDNFKQFIEEMEAYANEKLQHTEPDHDFLIDADLTNMEINEQFMRLLSQMEPYGYGNEKPLFLIRNVHLEEIKKVGKEKKHLHFQSRIGQQRYSTIAFKFGEYQDLLHSFPDVDLAFYLDKNIWNGKEYTQLQVADIRPSQG